MNSSMFLTSNLELPKTISSRTMALSSPLLDPISASQSQRRLLCVHHYNTTLPIASPTMLLPSPIGVPILATWTPSLLWNRVHRLILLLTLQWMLTQRHTYLPHPSTHQNTSMFLLFVLHLNLRRNQVIVDCLPPSNYYVLSHFLSSTILVPIHPRLLHHRRFLLRRHRRQRHYQYLPLVANQ